MSPAIEVHGEAMVQTISQHPIACGIDEGTNAKEVAPVLVVTPTKKRTTIDLHECPGLEAKNPKSKKRDMSQMEGVIEIPSAKTEKKAMSQLAVTGNMLHCVFHEGNCIP